MNESNDNRTINKTNSGFPDYLDFEKLRSEGIDYLGKLSGKIWTDHNIHDPGITILESLCYALLDLGYRTNLPFVDIFSRNPDDKTKDDNFFTASQIFACNPLTITDFRKLLIDLDGVKNAWLEPAEDFNPSTFCRPDRAGAVLMAATPIIRSNCCVEYLNGLYHVYIETDIKYDDDQSQKKFETDVVARVSEALMSHRNLCEDFLDVKVLCRLPVGVCADIELDDDGDLETVYVKLVEKLQDFLSPSPKFYTLQQLVEEKEKDIDEVFAGRPYNIIESHGFVDTVEFENIKLKKRIELSDLYKAIFEIKGIRRVQNLSIHSCDGKKKLNATKWSFELPEDHIPDFSVTCSGFKFSRYGMSLTPDFKKYEGLFELNFRHTGKILFKQPSPYLDYIIPKGNYRSDIGEYYSIQNEFPRVYGIAEGGLPDDASTQRQAQALQLKAYLLFFDQLLANYVAQLKNIRNLFGLSNRDKQNLRTYYTSLPESIPELQKLLRFKITEAGKPQPGNEGVIIAYPVDQTRLQSLIAKEKLNSSNLEKDFKQFYFQTSAENEIAVTKLRNDLIYGDYEPVIVAKNNLCYFFYLITSSCEYALVSRRYYESEQEAKTAAASLKYAGTFEENYKKFMRSSGEAYSFEIELNLAMYTNYLQLIVEDKELYHKRRQQFLDHLLSRFAERFTDYALLSYGLYDEQQLEAGVIKNKERFLSNYDDLSSNRGRACDYLQNGWNNNNVSGLEKRFKALAGIEKWKNHNLCHFEVYKYSEKYVSSLKISGNELFEIQEKFETKEEALMVTQELFRSMSQPGNYSTYYIPHERAHSIEICFEKNRKAVYKGKFENENEAIESIKLISEMFSPDISGENVFVSKFRYQAQLKDIQGTTVANYSDWHENTGKALREATNKINTRKNWQFTNEPSAPEGPFFADPEHPDRFINLHAFKIDINDTIIDRPEKFTYEVLDKNNQFKFHSLNEFDSPDQAREECYLLLTGLTNPENYKKDQDPETGKIRIVINYRGRGLATYAREFNTDKEIQKTCERIKNIVDQNQYRLIINEIPDRWKFRYKLGHESHAQYEFVPDNEGYESPGEAMAAAKEFSDGVSRIELKDEHGEFELVPKKAKTAPKVRLMMKSPGNMDVRGSLSQMLELRKEISQLANASKAEAFNESVSVDEESRCGQYVYHLVDNDKLIAFSVAGRLANNASAAELKRKSLIQKYAAGFSWLEIAMGGDIINKRKDPKTKRTTYHYQLKTLRPYFKPGDLNGRILVLFESTEGYATKEDAEKAFHENYLLVLMYARNLDNYLKEKLISAEESSIHVRDCCKTDETIVFIPRETLDYLGRYTEDAERELVKLVKTYPVRMIEYEPCNAEFKKRFPCEKCDKDDRVKQDPCDSDNKKYVFYFALFDQKTEEDEWQSTGYYQTARLAWLEFNFFVVLLRFEGNYFIKCDPCDLSYKIFIREVLAESTERFFTPAQAWGKTGIQNLICIAQTDYAFHNYQSKDDCCYSFFIGCEKTPLYHPCKYDTPELRDKSMETLYYSFQKYHDQKLPYLIDSASPILLVDGNGQNLATVVYHIDRKIIRPLDCSDATVELMHFILAEQLCAGKSSVRIQFDQENFIEFFPVDPVESLAELKCRLICLAWYYPIVIKEETRSGKLIAKFCIELRFPTFNPCFPNEITDVPCSCEDAELVNPASCPIAWKSACCYTTCEEAKALYGQIHEILSDFRNYKAEFDCNCGPYSIGLYHSPDIKDCLERGNPGDSLKSKFKMIALNPQCYPNPEMACEAVDRAKALINCEGLFLVEHILLRPHCERDCECEFYKRRCDQSDCEFIWNDRDEEDPCDETKPVCFIPGADPYSFVATVALPAWPQRFRSKENRALVENMLQREAPAHVLLRILWLAPHDLCCFEQYYKNWILWLAKKRSCDEFRICDFLEFLFRRNFECLQDCVDCNICPQNGPVTNPCFDDAKRKDPCLPEELEYVNQVNEIFCWKEINCCRYEYIECESRAVISPVDIIAAPALHEISAPPAETEPISFETTVEVAPPPQIPAPTEYDSLIKKPKKDFVNQRLRKYKVSVSETAKRIKNQSAKAMAGKTESFLMDNNPSLERLASLVEEIIQNTIPKGKARKAPLTKKHAEELIKNSLYHCLDKNCFNGKNLVAFRRLEAHFKKMGAAGFDMISIYKDWQPEEVKKYEPEIDLEMIRNLFLKRK